jgi:hypothetical protein
MVGVVQQFVEAVVDVQPRQQPARRENAGDDVVVGDADAR